MLHLLWAWRTRQLPLECLGLCFWTTAIDPRFISGYDPLEEIWFIGKQLNQVISNSRCSFCSGSKSHGMNFTVTCFMPRFCIKISDAVVLGIPRSVSSSCTVRHPSLLIVVCTRSTFSDILLVVDLPEQICILLTDSRPPLKHCCHTLLFALHLVHHP